MLDLFSEPFLPTGSTDARATRTALGVTDMGSWDVFLRETVQNSWDARGPAKRIRFEIDGYRTSAEQTAVLRDQVFSRVPPPLEKYRAHLRTSAAEVLLVSDIGTLGLGGPVRADKTAGKSERTDFRDFVRNVGRDASKDLGGGTYGFGKGVFYNASSIRTCIIYTQTRVQGVIEPRLIVARFDQRYSDSGNEFTGRHWWGHASELDGVLDPLIGLEARELCAALGMLRMEEDETGVSVAVVEPYVGDEPVSDPLRGVVERLSAATLRWAWPHMVSSGRRPSIRFSYSAYGSIVQVPDAETHPVVRHFVTAYRTALEHLATEETREGWPTSTRAIKYARGHARYLGQLAYTKWLAQGEDVSSEWSEQRYVALMRSPRLVVKYLPVQADPTGQQIAGVFIAAADVNDEFAAAEPVAHDDWKPLVVPASDGKRPPSPVRFALGQIGDEFRKLGASLNAAGGADQSPGIAHVSRLLGGALSGLVGGAEVSRGKAPSGPKGGGGSPKITISPDARLGFDSTGVFVDFSVDAKAVPAGSILVAEPVVVLDRGLERPEDRPAGADTPSVVGWLVDGELLRKGNAIDGNLLAPTGNCVRVRQPADSAISLIVRIREESSL